MITLATIDDVGILEFTFEEIAREAEKSNVNQAEAFKILLKKAHGPIYGHDYISDVYEINITQSISKITVKWRLKCATSLS